MLRWVSPFKYGVNGYTASNRELIDYFIPMRFTWPTFIIRQTVTFAAQLLWTCADICAWQEAGDIGSQKCYSPAVLQRSPATSAVLTWFKDIYQQVSLQKIDADSIASRGTLFNQMLHRSDGWRKNGENGRLFTVEKQSRGCPLPVSSSGWIGIRQLGVRSTMILEKNIIVLFLNHHSETTKATHNCRTPHATVKLYLTFHKHRKLFSSSS